MVFWFEFSWIILKGVGVPNICWFVLKTWACSIHNYQEFIYFITSYVLNHIKGGGGPNIWFVLNTCACSLHNYEEFIYFITSYVLNHIKDIFIKQYLTPGGKDLFTYLESISVSHKMSSSKIWKCSEARLSVFRIFESFWYLADIFPASLQRHLSNSETT